MQYTLRNVPKALDGELRRRARREGKSLNAFLLEILAQATEPPDASRIRRNLEDLAGSWVEDPAVDEALADQRRIDPEMWR